MSQPCTFSDGMYPEPYVHNREIAFRVGAEDARQGIYAPCVFTDELDQYNYDHAWRAAACHVRGAPIFVHQARNLNWRERRQLSVGMIVIQGRRPPR